MKIKKTIYYDDPLNDDFDEGSFHYKPLPKKYRFYRWGPIYWVFQEMIYYVFAIPILWLVGKIFWRYRVVGKRKLKRAHLGTKGYFLYGNHTTKADAIFAPVSICNPRHAFLICSDNAMSHRILLPLIRLLGAIPLPSYPFNRGEAESVVSVVVVDVTTCVHIPRIIRVVAISRTQTHVLLQPTPCINQIFLYLNSSALCHLFTRFSA